MWQLCVHAAHVPRLLPNIRFRHREKIVAKQLALVNGGRPWNVVRPVYKNYRKAIIVERNALEAIAARRFGLRADKRQRKNEIFRQRVESTFELFKKGLGVREVADSMSCSLRTAYRRREKFIEYSNANVRHKVTSSLNRGWRPNAAEDARGEEV